MTDKKIQNVWNKIIFKDQKTKEVAIVCERKVECRPPKSVDDYQRNGCDLIHEYEVSEWNLKEDKNQMPFEGGKYDGEEINDTGEWVAIVEEKYNLIYDVSEVDTVKVEWEDGTVTSEQF